MGKPWTSRRCGIRRRQRRQCNVTPEHADEAEESTATRGCVCRLSKRSPGEPRRDHRGPTSSATKDGFIRPEHVRTANHLGSRPRGSREAKTTAAKMQKPAMAWPSADGYGHGHGHALGRRWRQIDSIRFDALHATTDALRWSYVTAHGPPLNPQFPHAVLAAVTSYMPALCPPRLQSHARL